MAKTIDDKKIIYTMDRVSKFHGTKQVLKDISLSYFYGAKIGVIGANGSGKSSLLRILAQKDTDFVGDVYLQDGYTIGILEQEPYLEKGKTAKEIALEGVKDIVDLLQEFDKVNEEFGNPDADIDKLMARQEKIQEKLDETNAWELDNILELAMEALRCPPPDQIVDTLSGGERRRLALCRLLLQKPDILLLDEPTNHLDAETIAWLENRLQQYEGTIICVTHDRYFLDNVATWILELDRGEGIPWKGNYSSWLQQKSEQLRLEEKKETEKQKILQRELEWIGLSPKGRHAKSKARVKDYEKLLSNNSKEKIRELKMMIPTSRRLGSLVIDVQNVSKHYGDRLLFDNVSFTIPQGAIVGIVGPNGAGKTTLFKMIMGATGQAVYNGEEDKKEIITPDSGEIKIGESVKLGYADQMRDSLDENKTVWQQLSSGLDIIKLGDGGDSSFVQEVNSRAYCAWFNFSGQDQSKKIGVLSGGERNRINLAMMLKEGANVLLLDEPTNDLDVATLRSLEEALQDFAGSAIIVSHDRWFLDRVCTHLLVFEATGEVIWYDGNWSEYVVWRREKFGKDAETPKRAIYRKFER